MSLKQEGHGNSALRVRSKGKQRRVLGGHGAGAKVLFLLTRPSMITIHPALGTPAA